LKSHEKVEENQVVNVNAIHIFVGIAVVKQHILLLNTIVSVDTLHKFAAFSSDELSAWRVIYGGGLVPSTPSTITKSILLL
jgi:hypothetical protein